MYFEDLKLTDVMNKFQHLRIYLGLQGHKSGAERFDCIILLAQIKAGVCIYRIHKFRLHLLFALVRR